MDAEMQGLRAVDRENSAPKFAIGSDSSGGEVHPDRSSEDDATREGYSGFPPATGFISRVSPVQVRPLLVERTLTDGTTVTREPAAEYHKSPGISCSQLKDYASSPLGYWLRHVVRTAPPKTSAALRHGTLLHSRHELSLEEWQSRKKIAPDSVVTSTGQLGKAGEKWLADLAPDDIGLTAEEESQIEAQWAGILRNPAARRLLDARVDAEFNVRWRWEGHLMRCRCDGATDETWYDLKTTRDFNVLAQWGGSAMDWGYDLQAAVYGAAAVAAGWPPHRLAFIVTSNVWPHHCHVVHLPIDVVSRARLRALQYLMEIAQRTEFDHWLPDDYGEITEIRVPYRRY